MKDLFQTLGLSIEQIINAIRQTGQAIRLLNFKPLYL